VFFFAKKKIKVVSNGILRCRDSERVRSVE